MKKISQLLLVTVFSIISFSVQAQNEWTLKKCIQHAFENSLLIKQAQIQVENAKLTQKADKYTRLPILNASSALGMQFGKSIDPTTNSFEINNTGFNTIGFSASAILYNGGRMNNTIKQSNLSQGAATQDANQVKNDIALQVATSYLAVLMSEEQLMNAQNQLELTHNQLDKTLKMIKAGALPKNDKLDILARIALDEQMIVSRENDVERNYLILKQILLLEPSFNFKIEKPKTDQLIDQKILPDFSDLFQNAVYNQPFIQAGNLRIKAAELGVKLAKSQGIPTLSIFGNIDTRFSSLGKYRDGEQTIRIPQKVFFNGQEALIETDRNFPVFKDSPYGRQINDNLGQSIGLNLRIPIFNGYKTKISVAKAKLNVENIKIANEQKLQNLKGDIQRAIADVKAAKKAYDAAIKTKEAMQMAYLNTEKKFNLGAANVFDLSTAKNTLDKSKNDLTIAKYTYLFKQKVLEYFNGSTLY